MMRVILITLNLLAPIGLVLLALVGHFWSGLGVLFVTHMLTLIATLVPACPWWGPVVSRFEGEGVWLTIDDGPDPDDTPRVLEVLEEYGVKATFFVIGDQAQRWPGLVQAMLDAGHSVENHTQTHPQFEFWRLWRGGVRREIEAAQDSIAAVSGNAPTMFRAPAGMRNLFVHPILSKLGLRLIGWSVRGRDGVSTDRDAIIGRLVAGMEPGAILLMHEGKFDADGKSLIGDTLPQVLAAAQERGLSFVKPSVQSFF